MTSYYSYGSFQLINSSSSVHKPWISYYKSNHPTKSSLSSSSGGKRAPPARDVPEIITPKAVKETRVSFLDMFVDHAFQFVDQPYLPSQKNFAPVDEIGEAVGVSTIEGCIPDEFPQGVFVRNGANPIHGALKSAISIFGKSSHVWVEGEGMLHAVYFNKEKDDKWVTRYKNKYVETDSYKIDKQRDKPAFIPAVEGTSGGVLSGFIFNMLRFGRVNENFSNTSIFEHSGKYYTATENSMPQEIDINTLQTVGNWDSILDSWNRSFTSHPKKAPETGELVTFGFDAQKPYLVLGCISADGTKLIHKVDLKLERSVICHDIGVTQRYNVILDFPTIVDTTRLLLGGALIKFEKEKYARIGVMPRYGDADSIRWFEVDPCCVFHIINCYEEGDQVVIMACRAEESIIPGPEMGKDKFDWFSRGFKHLNSSKKDEGFLFARPFVWRLNMKTGIVENKSYLTGTDFSLDFPFINEKFTGIKNKFGYTQVVDSAASSTAGMSKYNGLAKLYIEEKNLNLAEGKKDGDEFTKVEYHMFPENTFCTGSAFVAKNGDNVEEDDGWVITFVHNETSDISQVYIVDAKKFSSEPVAKITLPCRVPYGFHGAFMPLIN
ncbi:hypothetical protein ACP275_05G134700 [Erythranthe tilingii]